MKSSCLMIMVLLAIAVVNASSTTVREASGIIPARVESEKNVLADEMRTGERIQESKQILKACTTSQEACHRKAAVCSKKCTNLPAKEHEKCTAKCSKCAPNC